MSQYDRNEGMTAQDHADREYGSFDLALLLIAEGVLILFLFWLMNCLTWDWDGGAMLGF